jgi:hypothetical protein
MRALRDFLLAPPDGAALDSPGVAAHGGKARLARRRSAPAPSASADERDAPRAVAVLCAADDAAAAGVAAASLLARRARASCGLALVWTGAAPAPRTEAALLAGRGARRLAAALNSRGVVARACGRGVLVALPADPEEALGVARRAAAAAGAAPAVLVLGGPRSEAFDAALAEQDRIIVLTRPGADATVAALAVASLPADAPAGAARTVALRPATRALAAAGLSVPSALRRALAPLVGEAGG